MKRLIAKIFRRKSKASMLSFHVAAFCDTVYHEVEMLAISREALIHELEKMHNYIVVEIRQLA